VRLVVNTDEAYDLAVKELMAEFDDTGSDKIRLTERDLLIQIREALRYVKAEVLGHQSQIDKTNIRVDGKASLKTTDDHEGRIRVLENFRWWILGAIGAAGFFGGWIAKHLPF
jgi:hypothetical protein